MQRGKAVLQEVGWSAEREMEWEWSEVASGDEAMAVRVSASRRQWQLELGEDESAPTLRETAEAARQAEAARIRAHPLVAAAFAAFPDAEFVAEPEPARGRQDWNRRA